MSPQDALGRRGDVGAGEGDAAGGAGEVRQVVVGVVAAGVVEDPGAPTEVGIHHGVGDGRGARGCGRTGHGVPFLLGRRAAMMHLNPVQGLR